MHGLYIHIPFCKKACHYCDFHFSTSLKHKSLLVEALKTEIELQKNFLPSPTLNTIYFGGGTPSLLSDDDLKGILETVHTHFEIAPGAEITLEANPDDVTAQKVQSWAQQGINRLSMGIQSFFEEDLLWMNRAHNSLQAQTCIDIALQSGIQNITADLIYGYPLLNDEKWSQNIETLLRSGVNHLSAYSLTIEPKTALAHRIKKGLDTAPKNEQAAHHFEILMNVIDDAGWEHYEISNYCKPGSYAIHNTNYWKNQPYLGIGPSAHSYNGNIRRWNIANNATYIQAINNRQNCFEVEELTPADAFNEYVMTGLRTQWGINTQTIEERWGNNYKIYIEAEAAPFIQNGYLIQHNNTYTLAKEGKLVADYIASELFWVAAD